MRTGLVGGAPGVFVSGVMWLIAAAVWTKIGIVAGFAALFAGGALIMPLAMLILKFGFRAPPPTRENPLNRLGLESTFVLMGGLLVGYVLLVTLPVLAFPALALIMGVRYFLFRTIYGDPLYWGLAASISVAATLALLGHLSGGPMFPALVGAIELVFAGLLLLRWRRTMAA